MNRTAEAPLNSLNRPRRKVRMALRRNALTSSIKWPLHSATSCKNVNSMPGHDMQEARLGNEVMYRELVGSYAMNRRGQKDNLLC